MYRAGHGGPRTLSKITHANLDGAFVEKALLLMGQTNLEPESHLDPPDNDLTCNFQKTIGDKPGVISAKVNLKDELGEFEYDPGASAPDIIVDYINQVSSDFFSRLKKPQKISVPPKNSMANLNKKNSV